MSDRGQPEPSDEELSRVRALLAQVAADGATVTYSELRATLGETHGKGDLVPLLRAVSLIEHGEGRGLLSAVVVGNEGRPGGGWFRLANDLGRTGSDEEVWRSERARLQREHRSGPQ